MRFSFREKFKRNNYREVNERESFRGKEGKKTKVKPQRKREEDRLLNEKNKNAGFI